MAIVTDLVGVPFADRGRSLDGFDCWGLCCEVYRRFGLELPEYSLCCRDTQGFSQAAEAERPRWTRHEWPNVPVPALVALKFNAAVINHVGVYIGDGKFIHTREKTGVVIERVDSPIWRHRIEGYYTYGNYNLNKTQ